MNTQQFHWGLVCFLLGMIFVVIGCHMFWEPLAWIVGGLMLVGIGAVNYVVRQNKTP